MKPPRQKRPARPAQPAQSATASKACLTLRLTRRNPAGKTHYFAIAQTVGEYPARPELPTQAGLEPLGRVVRQRHDGEHGVDAAARRKSRAIGHV